MLIVHRLLAIFLLTLTPLAADASDEGTVALSEFQLMAAEAPPLGHAVVSGSHSYPNFTRLEAEAFGRKFSLTPEQLSKLKGFSPNGAYLSQTTAGYHSPPQGCMSFYSARFLLASRSGATLCSEQMGVSGLGHDHEGMV